MYLSSKREENGDFGFARVSNFLCDFRDKQIEKERKESETILKKCFILNFILIFVIKISMKVYDF